MRWFRGIMVVAALLIGSVGAALANPAPPASPRPEDSVEALTLDWFSQMQAGQIDRTQLTAQFSAQLTDDALEEMSRHLKLYGASPAAAKILQRRTTENQTIYLVKLLFPRGDAASLLVGLSAAGKITAISIVSMAGD